MPDSSFASIVAFAAVAAVLVVTPGVGTASLIATVATHGRRPGYLMAGGMVIGTVIHAIVTAVGTTALLHVFPRALQWIAIIGGLFIVWLGLKSVLAAMRGPADRTPSSASNGRHAFVTTGLFIALGNAPIPLFYLVVVPQYVPRTMSRLGGALLLSFIHVLMAGTWMTTLVTVLGKIVDVLRRPRVSITLQLLTGTVLLFLGARSIHGAL